MSLDLHLLVPQIETTADHLRGQLARDARRLDTALGQLRSADASALERRRQAGKVTFLVPGVTGPPARRVPPPPLPHDFAVVATDGSQIDVSRHAPARCYLINLGLVDLRYGSSPHASLTSEPRLYAAEDDLAISDPNDRLHDQAVEGPLLGILRGIRELQALADLAEALPPRLPALALVDGSLVLWGLTAQGYPDFVKRRLLQEDLLPTLDRFHRLASERPVALAAYVSYPRGTEVVNALRLGLCPYEPPNCDQHCRQLRPGDRPCDGVHGLLDRTPYAHLLGDGDRSSLFASQSSVVREHYGGHQVLFFYLNVGQEIARVEVPAWVAESEALLALAHALAYDQCRRGMGYPVALAEAHEQAVVTGPDRAEFTRLLEEAMGARRLSTAGSEKDLSKRLRWV